EMRLSEEEEHTPEYKRQFLEDHKQKLAELDERMRGLTSQGAKSESGAKPFVYDSSKEPKVEPSFKDRVEHPIDAWHGKLPGQKPVAPPTPKPIGKSPTTSSNW
ncbi:MAG: hypothetical protein RL236_2082, partial [Pseudomonadota bacterium]